MQVVVVSPYPNPKNLYWRPDGSPSAEHYDTDDRPTVSPWPDDGRRLVFQFGKPVPPGSDYQLQFSLPIGTNSYPSAGNHPTAQLVSFEKFPTGAKTVSIRLGVASAAWSELATYEPGADTTVFLPVGFEFQRPKPWISGTELRVLAPDPSIELRMFAIDSQRHEHSSTATMFSQSYGTDPRSGMRIPSQTKRELTFMFENLPPSKIVAYRLESRKYQFVEFSNVVLDPEKPEPALPLSAAELIPPKGFGRVVDVENRPVVGAALIDKAAHWSAISGPAGLFPLPVPPPRQFGQFKLTVEAVGFARREDVMLLLDPSGALLEQSLLVDVSKRPTEGRGIIELQRPGRVEGRVLGPDGKPLAAAPVELDVRNYFDGVTHCVGSAASTLTDANGRFTIDNVLPGELLLRYPGSNARSPIKGVGAGLRATLANGQTLNGVVLDSSKSTAGATGRVVDKTGSAVAGAEVAFVWDNGGGWNRDPWPDAISKTDDRGQFRLARLPPGNWHILVSVGTTNFEPVPVTLRENHVSTADVVLPVENTSAGAGQRELALPLDASQLPPPDGFGRVVDMQHRPIAGAILINAKQNWETDGKTPLKDEKAPWWSTSAGDGLFRLPPMEPGKFSDQIHVSLAGFASLDYQLNRGPDGKITSKGSRRY